MNHPDEFPKTVVEAVDWLESVLSDDGLAQLAAMDEGDIASLHFGLGSYVHNSLDLWRNEALMADADVAPDRTSLQIHIVPGAKKLSGARKAAGLNPPMPPQADPRGGSVTADTDAPPMASAGPTDMAAGPPPQTLLRGLWKGHPRLQSASAGTCGRPPQGLASESTPLPLTRPGHGRQAGV